MQNIRFGRILGVLILLLSAPALAQSGAYSVGRIEAQKLWNMGYPCDSFTDVLDTFRPDVESQVFDYCEQQYSHFPGRLQDCKDGAYSVVRDKVNACTNIPEDCNALGDLAAEIVAAAFCEAGIAPRAGFPPVCADIAKNRCKSEVVGQIDGYIQNDLCPTISDVGEITQDQYRGLQQSCEREVDDLILEL